MKTELPYRHEFKYRCTAAQLQVLKGRLDAVMALDSHAGAAGYTIRSMYFDNYENQYYYENENGTDPREKYRIRIYNADASRITLECKRKGRMVYLRPWRGQKHRCLCSCVLDGRSAQIFL